MTTSTTSGSTPKAAKLQRAGKPPIATRAQPGPRPVKLRERLADPLFNVVAMGILLIGLVAVIYPLYFVVIASVSDPAAIYEGRVWLWPQGFTIEGYQHILGDGRILRGFANSVLYTVVGTAIAVTITLCAGYALSRKDLPFRRILMSLFIITMFFDGGLIARYLVVRDLGFLNTIWAVVLPGAVSVWNLIIARSFFEQNIPQELMEAAMLDGASDINFFTRIVVPLSVPLIMLMTMTHMVGYWNSFFDALIYLQDDTLYPLQLILRNILIQQELTATAGTGSIDSYAAAQRIAELTKYAMIIISSAPLLIALPFLQKHFTKGALIGAVKS
jgi:putative aldouronate transport system permease protein